MLYSHRHALLAEIDAEPVGLILAYDGAHYHSLRTRTFALLPAFAGMDVDSMEDEATVGEYYIDSLAVAPTARGRGVGRALLAQAVQRAARLQLRPTLLVDPDNPGHAGSMPPRASRNGSVTAFGQTIYACNTDYTAFPRNTTSAPSFRRRSEGAFT